MEGKLLTDQELTELYRQEVVDILTRELPWMPKGTWQTGVGEWLPGARVDEAGMLVTCAEGDVFEITDRGPTTNPDHDGDRYYNVAYIGGAR